MDAALGEHLLPPLADIVKDYLAPKTVASPAPVPLRFAFHLFAGRGQIVFVPPSGPHVVATAVDIIHYGTFPDPLPAHRLRVHYMGREPKRVSPAECDVIHVNNHFVPRASFPPPEDFVQFCRRAGLEPTVQCILM
jgi:hypothetical protein